MKPYGALAARIRSELGDLLRCVDRAQGLLAKASSTGDTDYLDGVALNLHAFYTGVEHVLEAIAREVDDSVPSGPEWHRDLLLQMSAPIPHTRPAVLGADTRHCLDAYRGFRHVVRNVYGYNLDPARIRDLVAGLGSCYRAVADELEVFARVLERLAESAA